MLLSIYFEWLTTVSTLFYLDLIEVIDYHHLFSLSNVNTLIQIRITGTVIPHETELHIHFACGVLAAGTDVADVVSCYASLRLQVVTEL